MIKIFLFCCSTMLFSNILGQEILHYQIAPVYNFKNSILSVTFDDGALNNFTEAIPILDERSIPATFYINSMKFDTKYCSLIKLQVKNIHEIGGHTANHYDLTKISLEDVRYEIQTANTATDSVFTNQKCVTFAYPFGSYNNSIENIAADYYLCARSLKGGYNNLTSYDKYALNSMTFGILSIEQMNKNIERLKYNGEWMISTFHGLDNIGWSPIKKEDLTKHLDLINENKHLIWCATVSDAIKYLEERKTSFLKCYNCNINEFNIGLEDYKEDHLFDHQLSIKLKIPNDWQHVTITNGELIKVEDVNSARFVFFNATPNGDTIKIKPISFNQKDIIEISPNPFQSFIDIEYPCDNHQLLKAEIFNNKGSLLKVIDFPNNSNYNSINTEDLPTGLYYIRIFKSNGVMTKKLIKQ